MIKTLVKVGLLIISLLPYMNFAIGRIIIGDNSTNNIYLWIFFYITFGAIPFEWIFYIINVFVNKGVPKNQRGIWVIFLLGGSFVAFPIYWYFHIWGEPKKIDDDKEVQSPDTSGLKGINNLNKVIKLGLFIVCLLPYLFLIWWASTVGIGEPIKNTFLIVLGTIVLISITAEWIFYILNVYKNTGVLVDRKNAWVFFLLLGSIIAFPVYWYFHIWRESYNNNGLNSTSDT